MSGCGCGCGHFASPPVSRSKDIVEPLIKPQWWLNCTDMAKEAVEVSNYDDIH